MFKTEKDLNKEDQDFFGLKSSMSRLAASSFEVTNSGKQAFFSDLPKQITTLGALYTKVFDRFTLRMSDSRSLRVYKTANILQGSFKRLDC